MSQNDKSGESGGGNLYKVTFDLKEERAGWPPVSVERLWAETTGVKLELRLVNIPYFARGVSVGDRVQVRPDHDRREFVYDKLTAESGHSTVRIVLIDAGSRSEIESKIVEFGCSWEGTDRFPVLFAVDIPPAVDYRTLRYWLEMRTADRVIEFQESAISSLHRAQLPSFP